MAKYRKKPVVIDAVRLPAIDEDPSDEVMQFLDMANATGSNVESDRDGGVVVYTLEGDMRGDPGDWLIRGVKGEIYPCKPDVFEATYDRVDD